MLLKKTGYALLFVLVFASCKMGSDVKSKLDTAVIDGHPAWIMQGNIYEVNVRQYTTEGTFKAFAQHLDRLKEMGVQTLWFMPINPIGVKDRKGVLGSYYAVSSYTAINPEFGTMEDWNNLVKECHEKGFKVIIDWVPNHTGADHPWLKSHPDFYVQDSVTKQAISPFDWTDARKLNYNNVALQDSMIASMKFWLDNSNIDGFRCDVASEVPEFFWKKCIPELRKGRNIFMLAEADKPWMHTAGFDATYGWSDFAMMKKIANGERKAFAIDSTINYVDTAFQKNAMRLFFTSNHDENSWNKADYATMPGDVHAPFAVLTQTMKRSISLIYSGQEEPFLDSISFFYKDTITFKEFKRANFYSKLLNLRKNNEALSANAGMIRLQSSSDDRIYAFIRELNGKKVLVIVNLSKDFVNGLINSPAIEGTVTELFSDAKTTLKADSKFELKPWDYKVYVY